MSFIAGHSPTNKLCLELVFMISFSVIFSCLVSQRAYAFVTVLSISSIDTGLTKYVKAPCYNASTAPATGFSSISSTTASSSTTSASAASAAVNAAIDEKTKSSPIYDDVKKILEEISQGLGEGSSVELDAISGADVIVKLSGPVASGMMKDMTLGLIKQKLTDGTGRQISVTTR